jgi:hypothetical protein
MFRSLSIAILCSLVFAGQGNAQGRPIELGIDLGIEFDIEDVGDETVKTTGISIPLAYLRAAFYASDQVWIEPRMTLLFLDTEDASTTALNVVGGLGVDFQTDPTRARAYIRPFGSLLYVDTSDRESATQVSLGSGIGVKVPMLERLASRLEGGVSYSFENDDFASGFDIHVTFGFSFFTR